MNQLLTVLVTSISAGFVPIVIAALSYSQARKANQQTLLLEQHKVDSEAFITAQTIYKNAINELETQLARANQRITELEYRLSSP